MSIKYESTTWKKKITNHYKFVKSLYKIDKSIDYHYYNMETVIKHLEDNSFEKDRLSAWSSAYIMFDIAAEMYRLENKDTEMLCNIYLAIKSFTQMYKLFCKGYKSDTITKEEINSSHEEYACRIISIDAIDEFKNEYINSVIFNLYLGNKIIKNKIEDKFSIPWYVEKNSLDYFLRICCLKPLIYDILEQDKNAFKKDFEQLLRKRRSGGVDFSVTIDYYGVALLKCSMKYNIGIDISTIEMPQIMFSKMSYKDQLYNLPVPKELLDHILKS